MSTIKQKQTAVKTLENIGKGPKKTKGEILREVGYSEAVTKNPKLVYDTKGYDKAESKLLKKLNIDFNSRLEKLASIFHDSDKRSTLGANKEITSMLGEYKQGSSKIVGLFETLKDLE